ncbi:MAG: hypothetical protein DRG78_20725 [Epsilonproteobacteria bacterium]|nr:MAG: hypothetical protein DRG78_20725 [Campylobacterota bacterium]
MVKKKYNYKKTIWKGVEICIYGAISYLFAYLTKLPQTQTIAIGLIVLRMLKNYLKHRWQIKLP